MPRADPAGLGVQQVAPGLRRGRERRGARRVPVGVRDERQAEVRHAVLQRGAGLAWPALQLLERRGRRGHGQPAALSPGRGAALDQPEQVAVELAGQRRVDEAAAPALGDERHDRVAGHVAGVAGSQLPARQAARDVGPRRQRREHVRVALRLQHREQRVLPAVGVPQRELAVARPVADADLLVRPAPATVDVAVQVREELRVVERGREARAVQRGAAGRPARGSAQRPRRPRRRRAWHRSPSRAPRRPGSRARPPRR